jgi:hypothetical protein
MDRLTVSLAPSVPTAVVAKPRAQVLELVVLAHLFLVTFQLPLRALVFDTTLYRDVLLLSAIGLWGLGVLRKKGRVKSRNALDYFVSLYLLYGVFTVIVALSNNVPLLDAMTQMRNTFFPAGIYFVAKRAFASPEAQSRLINVLIVFAIIQVLDVLGESMVQRAGFSLSTIPWYPYVFKTNYRFIGNEVLAKGYILPEDTPILGLLGYPHYTVATLMALFAFSYPLLIEKNLKDLLGAWSPVAVLPAWFRRGIGFAAVVAVFILGVRTHLVSLVFVFMILPFFTQPKIILRNLFIIGGSGLVLVAAGLLEPGLARIQTGLLGEGTRDSSLSFILSLSEIKFIATSTLPRVLLGNADISSQVFSEVGAFEMKLLFFTAAFGLIWLILFLGIYITGFVYLRRILFDRLSERMTKLFAVGAIGALTVFLLDMGHYGRTMWAPNIDIWMVLLGTVSVMIIDRPKETLRNIALDPLLVRRRSRLYPNQTAEPASSA